MREIKDRNTEQHQEGNSVNTEQISFIFNLLIYFSPIGEGEGNKLHQHDTRNRPSTPQAATPWNLPPIYEGARTARWSRSTSILKILINHTLGQDLLFVATPVVNNFERARISSDSLTFSQGGTGSPLWTLTEEYMVLHNVFKKGVQEGKVSTLC